MSQDQRPTPAAGGPPGAGPARTNWLALVAAAVAVLMTTIDLMIVQTALPHINDSFAVSPNVGQWLVLAYAGTMVALQLPAGRWLDGVSPRAGFVFAITAFTVTSVLCAIAPNVELLIAARALQGAAGAVLGALVPGLVIMSATAANRGRAMGIVGTLGPLGGVFGPAVGGVLLSVWDWRAIFLVNIPVGLVALALGLRSIPGGRRISLPDRTFAVEALAALLAGGAFFLALTLVSDRTPEYGYAGALLVLAVVAGYWWYRQPGGRALTTVLTTGRLGLILLATTGALIGGAALNYLAPFTLSEDLDLPVAQWGLVLFCLPAGMAVASNVGGFLTDWLGGKRTAVFGAGLLTVAAALLAVDPGWGGSFGLAVRLALAGLGIGFFNVPTQTMFMAEAPPMLRGTAGAATAVVRSLAFSLGPALATLAWLTAGGGTAGGLSYAYVVALAGTILTLVVILIVPSRLSQAPPAASGTGAGATAPSSTR